MVYVLKDEYVEFVVTSWGTSLTMFTVFGIFYLYNRKCECNMGDQIIGELCFAVQKETCALLSYQPTCIRPVHDFMRFWVSLCVILLLAPSVFMPCMMRRVDLPSS